VPSRSIISTKVAETRRPRKEFFELGFVFRPAGPGSGLNLTEATGPGTIFFREWLYSPVDYRHADG